MILAATSGVSGIAVVIGVLYFLPTLIAGARRTNNGGSVLLINLFLGWTIIGWWMALGLASSGAAGRQKGSGRVCPACGRAPKVGQTTCRGCGHEFALAAGLYRNTAQVVQGSVAPPSLAAQKQLEAFGEWSVPDAVSGAQPEAAVATAEESSRGTKVCPQCAEEVKAAALMCRFCGYRFDARLGQATAPSRENTPRASVRSRLAQPVVLRPTTASRSGAMSLVKLALIAVAVLVILIAVAAHALAPASAPAPPPPPTPLTISGHGFARLGTITIPAGGAVMKWSCSTCDGTFESVIINNTPPPTQNDVEHYFLSYFGMDSAFQDHPTYGANNNVEPGAYGDVTVSVPHPPDDGYSDSWTLTFVPKVSGQLVTEAK